MGEPLIGIEDVTKLFKTGGGDSSEKRSTSAPLIKYLS